MGFFPLDFDSPYNVFTHYPTARVQRYESDPSTLSSHKTVGGTRTSYRCILSLCGLKCLSFFTLFHSLTEDLWTFFLLSLLLGNDSNYYMSLHYPAL